MSIGKRIFEAIEKIQANDPYAALTPASIAVDATSAKFYSHQGRSSYKRFVRENFSFISRISFGGSSIGELRVPFSHPQIVLDSDGLCSSEEVFYHVIRCGLLHDACLPSALTFNSSGLFSVENGILSLPTSLIYGLILAVVVCPSNVSESLPSECAINVNGNAHRMSTFWGKKSDLLAVLEAKKMP